MKIIELIIIFFILFVYITIDLFQSKKHSIKQNYDISIEALEDIEKKMLNVKLGFISKNVWGLQGYSKEITSANATSYQVSNNKKNICINNRCFELIGIENKNRVIFYDKQNKKFITLHKNEMLDKNLTITKIGNKVILKDNNATYNLERGFVDINLYKGNNSESSK